MFESNKLSLGVVAIFLAFSMVADAAKKKKSEINDAEIFVAGERPFDAVNIFGDFGKSVRLSNTEENKIWWERMVRGEVGRERFLILCALRDGDWKSFDEIRDYVEFQLGEIYGAGNMHKMLVLMAGIPGSFPNSLASRRIFGGITSGEGWLEKRRGTDPARNQSVWRIEMNVFPLLYFLLMTCPEDNRCLG